MKLATKDLGAGVVAHFREGTSDADALAEVVERHTYRRLKDGFEVRPGERWLDLGANIGSFALYCRLRNATAVCYEPEPTCFEILKLNAYNFELHNSAITNLHDEFLPFFKSKNEANHYRTTILPVASYQDAGRLTNMHASTLKGQTFDGIKCDIEGSEFGLIDEWLFPECNKLVMELHTSRDPSAENCARRLNVMRSHFDHVHTTKALLDFAAGKAERPRFDQVVFCWNS